MTLTSVKKSVVAFIFGSFLLVLVSPVFAKDVTRSASSGAKLETRMEFKAKLDTIKDERKRTIASNLTEKMALVNKRRTDFWNNVLTKLTQILARAKTKSAELKASGKDTIVVDTAIASADTTIKNAQTAVDNQAAKIYPLSFTSESTLKASIGKTISGEQADLQAVKKSVDEAHKAVSDVIRLLKQIK